MLYIPTKWEWIAEKCEEKGLKEGVKIARKIDKILEKIYGKRHTEQWVEDYPPSPDWIYYIAQMSSYCVACVIEERDCSRCKFGKVAGKCVVDKNSLFQQFLRKYAQESKEVKKC